MRAGFQLGILLFAGLYSYYAFTDLSWLSSAGRIGPAFFPRIIGVALVVLCAWSLVADRRQAGERITEGWRAAALLALLSGIFVAALEVLGGLLAMIAFMATSLALFNRGRWLQNALLALVLPAGMVLLFKVWLNAAMPRGLLLPF